MKIDTSTVTKLLITEVPNLDPITVFLEDYGQNRGKMIVECYGRSWSAYWGSMGASLKRFIKDTSTDYIARRMFNGELEQYDAEGMETMLKKALIKLRRDREISRTEAQGLMHLIDTEDFEHPYHMDSTMMTALIGDDWHVCLPFKTNPDFDYLLRIIDATREAITQTYPEKT